jgi:hypothetical protein
MDDTVKILINGIKDWTLLHYGYIMINKIAIKYLLKKNPNTNSESIFFMFNSIC